MSWLKLAYLAIVNRQQLEPAIEDASLLIRYWWAKHGSLVQKIQANWPTEPITVEQKKTVDQWIEDFQRPQG
jgi:hypothetical protein